MGLKGRRGRKDKSTTLTKREISRAIGVSLRQIDNLVAEGMPVERDGRRNVYTVDSIRYYVDKKLEQLQRESPGGIQRAQERKALVQAELAEMELAKKRGELITVGVAELALVHCLHRLRSSLLPLPGEIAPQLVGLRSRGEGEVKLEGAIHDALRHMVEDADALDLKILLNGATSSGESQKKTKKSKKKRGS